MRHKGRLYHIQTEDSGVNHPHVITHLFADGGRIIASRKTSYAGQVGAEDLAVIVRKLMQEQHKAVFIELRDCVYDGEHEQEPNTQDAAATRPATKGATDDVREAPHDAPNGGADVGRDGRGVKGAPVAAEQDARTADHPPADDGPPESGTVRTVKGRKAPREAPADVAMLEAAAAARTAESVTGRARALTPKQGAGRYQQTFPANRRAKTPAQAGPTASIFGGDLIPGKSLDEVILSYLSDDMADG